jgi:hypothetical protein
MPSREEILQKLGKLAVGGIAAASTVLGRDGTQDPTPPYIPHVSNKEAAEQLAKEEQAARNKEQNARPRDTPVKGKGRGRRKPENPSQGRTTPRNAPRKNAKPKYEDFTDNRQGKRAARREAGFAPEPAARSNGGRHQVENRPTGDQRGPATQNHNTRPPRDAARGRDSGPGNRQFSNRQGRKTQEHGQQAPPRQYSTKQGQRNAEPPRRSK